MYKYIIKRLMMLIPVILGISFIVFSIISLTPGDPARIILGNHASEEAVENLRQELGLNEPFIKRYISYVGSSIKGDFGSSYRTGKPVFEDIFGKFPLTLKLALFSMLLATALGIPIGIISAVKRYSIIDGASMIFALLMTSMPSFWIGLMLILIFSIKLDIFPVTGVENIKGYVLPTITLASFSMAIITRMTRSTMLEVIRQDYVRTARAKGASTKRIIFKHCIRNALIPVVTVIGINFGILLGGTVITETVFALPGLGTLLVSAIRMKDMPIVMGAVIFLAIAFSIINLLVDLIYAVIDPRVKAQYSR